MVQGTEQVVAAIREHFEWLNSLKSQGVRGFRDGHDEQGHPCLILNTPHKIDTGAIQARVGVPVKVEDVPIEPRLG